jgi:hypothetical protein
MKTPKSLRFDSASSFRDARKPVAWTMLGLAFCALGLGVSVTAQDHKITTLGMTTSTLASRAPREAISWPTVLGYHKMFSYGDRIILAGGETDSASLSVPLPAYEYDVALHRWYDIAQSVPSTDNVGFDARAGAIVQLMDVQFPPGCVDWTTCVQLVNDTYTVNVRNGEIVNMHPSVSPPAGLSGGGAPIAYDSRADKMVMFGGLNWPLFVDLINGNCDDACLASILANDVWVYDLHDNTWTKMATPGDRPAPRNSNMLTYDSRADRVILFGGGDVFQNYNDIWAYDLEHDAWTQMQPPTQPSPRAYGSLAYDPVRDVIVQFGGVDYDEALTDNVVWSFDYSKEEWTSAPNVNGPSARGWHDMTFHHGDFYLYGGGVDRMSFTDELWVYRPRSNSWEQIVKP